MEMGCELFVVMCLLLKNEVGEMVGVIGFVLFD